MGNGLPGFDGVNGGSISFARRCVASARDEQRDHKKGSRGVAHGPCSSSWEAYQPREASVKLSHSHFHSTYRAHIELKATSKGFYIPVHARDYNHSFLNTLSKLNLQLWVTCEREQKGRGLAIVHHRQGVEIAVEA